MEIEDKILIFLTFCFIITAIIFQIINYTPPSIWGLLLFLGFILLGIFFMDEPENEYYQQKNNSDESKHFSAVSFWLIGMYIVVLFFARWFAIVLFLCFIIFQYFFYKRVYENKKLRILVRGISYDEWEKLGLSKRALRPLKEKARVDQKLFLEESIRNRLMKSEHYTE